MVVRAALDPFPHLGLILTVDQWHLQASGIHEPHQGAGIISLQCVFTPQDPGLCSLPMHQHALGSPIPARLSLTIPRARLTPDGSRSHRTRSGRLQRGLLSAGGRVPCRSALKPSALLFCPSYAVSALPYGGSESGRSTPSLSVHSDSRPPSSTYQQAPRHFHVPGRFLHVCRFLVHHLGHT